MTLRKINSVRNLASIVLKPVRITKMVCSMSSFRSRCAFYRTQWNWKHSLVFIFLFILFISIFQFGDSKDFERSKRLKDDDPESVSGYWAQWLQQPRRSPKTPHRFPDESEIGYNLTASRKQKLKLILFWAPFWSGVATHDAQREHFEGVELFKRCKIKDCYLTNNHEQFMYRELDAIIWENIFSRVYDAPETRYPHTRYIIANREGPARYGKLRVYPFKFNWTMTYRVDSDIPFRYGYIYKLAKPIEPDLGPLNKTALAAWMCSDNNSRSGREQLRIELAKHMKFDTYGSEGSFKCGTKCRARKGDECDSICRDMIASKYKFYFAFEPALCRDWVTEKLYTFLQRPIIPVVWSGANLTLLAPPHSVINALDFPTAKALTDYLKYLDNNDTAYYEYFKWKRSYGIIAGTESMTLSFCQLCARLHQDTEPKWYDNLHHWWKTDQCIDPNSPPLQKFLNITNDIKLPYPTGGQMGGLP